MESGWVLVFSSIFFLFYSFLVPSCWAGQYCTEQICGRNYPYLNIVSDAVFNGFFCETASRIILVSGKGGDVYE